MAAPAWQPSGIASSSDQPGPGGHVGLLRQGVDRIAEVLLDRVLDRVDEARWGPLTAGPLPVAASQDTRYGVQNVLTQAFVRRFEFVRAFSTSPTYGCERGFCRVIA